MNNRRQFLAAGGDLVFTGGGLVVIAIIAILIG
jgi:hypothetical protein